MSIVVPPKPQLFGSPPAFFFALKSAQAPDDPSVAFVDLALFVICRRCSNFVVVQVKREGGTPQGEASATTATADTSTGTNININAYPAPSATLPVLGAVIKTEAGSQPTAGVVVAPVGATSSAVKTEASEAAATAMIPEAPEAGACLLYTSPSPRD